MNQELMFRAQFLQKQAEEIEQSLEVVDREINDLQNLDTSLDFLIKSNEKSTISTIGKGLHIKTQLESKELFVEVGAGVVVKKSPEEARKVIQNQIKKLAEARIHMMNKLAIYHQTLESVVEEIGKEQGTKNHDENHEHQDHKNHKHS